MKNYKRAQRRFDEKRILEKRLKVWVNQGDTFKFPYNGDFKFFGGDYSIRIGGHYVEDVKNEVRAGKFWNFLKWTSTPCSCSMCSYPKYERPLRSKVQKDIWKDIQDDMAL